LDRIAFPQEVTAQINAVKCSTFRGANALELDFGTISKTIALAVNVVEAC
tara:strand:+ start:204 stop:353 length:150 start_codon:yes stop_codon:yes gene_type:complete